MQDKHLCSFEFLDTTGPAGENTRLKPAPHFFNGLLLRFSPQSGLFRFLLYGRSRPARGIG